MVPQQTLNIPMKRIITLINLLLLTATITVSAQKTDDHAIVRGRVYDQNSNEPLPFTNLVIYGTQIGATSDIDGNFEIKGVKPGFAKVSASSVGYKNFISEEIMVTNAKVVYLNIPMVRTNIELELIVVKASPFRKTEESPVSMRTLSIKQLERSPGGNRDVSKVIQALPGVASTVSFRNDVIVRGGGPGENKFYLDGMEIPNLNHFATQGASGGPIGMLNIDFIREIDFYSGAFPANRGNALSSVLDMKQVDGNPERLITKGSIGATDVSLALNGPLSDRTTFLFSARRSYLKFLFDVIGLPFLPVYNDFQFKVKTKFDQKNELTILGIGAIDEMKLNTGLEDPDESQQYILNYLPVQNQWNYALGAVYKHYRKNSFDTWVYSRNMLNNESYKHLNNIETNPLTQEYTSQEIANKLRYENSTRIGDFKVVSGAGLEYAKYNNSTFLKVVDPNETDTLRAIDFNSELDMFLWTAFSQVSKGFYSDRLILSLGVRMDGSNYSDEFHDVLKNWSPRFSLAYALTDRLFVNMNTGRYLQMPAYTTLGFRNNNGTLVNKYNDLEFIKSDHLVLGFEYRRVENAKITLEGFYKNYSDYPVSVSDSISLANKGGDFGVYGNEEVTSTGKGRAYGAELYVRERIFDLFDIIGSYTYVRSEFKDFSGKYIPSSWDSRHLLNLTLSREFSKNWYVGLKWRLVGGSPYTPYDLDRSSLREAYLAEPRGYLNYNKYNTERLEPFHHLDVRVDKQFFFERLSLTLYMDIQNAYNYQSAEQPFLLAKTDQNGQMIPVPGDPSRIQLREISSKSGTVLPSIGIIVEF